MLTFSLVTLFVTAASVSLLVLADSWLRGNAAYRMLARERSRLVAQDRTARVAILSVWTGEHSPTRLATRPLAPLNAAA